MYATAAVFGTPQESAFHEINEVHARVIAELIDILSR